MRAWNVPEKEGSTVDDAGASLVSAWGFTDPRATERPPGDLLPRLLRAAREHLGMDISFISEFTEGFRVFRYVDPPENGSVRVGTGDPLGESYCQRVIDGRLPELIVDARDLPAAKELSATRELPVGAHLSVPLVLSDGSIYGTFCCFSHQSDPSLDEQDLGVIRLFADVASSHLESELEAARRRESIRDRIEAALTTEADLTTVYQPIIGLAEGRLIGVEALSRFPDRTPDVWFAEATAVGLGVELEVRAVRSALDALSDLPNDVCLTINVSPQAALSARLHDLLAGVDAERVVLEMTEYAPVEDYARLIKVLRPLRRRGLRIAIDDAGAGYASFRHILRLQPEWIKLDFDLTRDVDADPARRALAASLISFAGDSDSSVIAEGVETQGELQTLRALGTTAAQGYYLGRPTNLAEAIGRRDLATNRLEQRTPSPLPRSRSETDD